MASPCEPDRIRTHRPKPPPRAGRNWMRWLYTSVNILGWLSVGVFWNFYREILRTMRWDWFGALTAGISTLIGLAALVLLHTPATREWFRARARER